MDFIDMPESGMPMCSKNIDIEEEETRHEDFDEFEEETKDPDKNKNLGGKKSIPIVSPTRTMETRPMVGFVGIFDCNLKFPLTEFNVIDSKIHTITQNLLRVEDYCRMKWWPEFRGVAVYS
jgi:hypothetical protein